MPVKSHILFSLYQRLKASPCSMSHLRLWKEANHYDVSDRTMYRYLNDLNQLMGLKWGEKLEVVQVKNKRKHWQISPFSASENPESALSKNPRPVQALAFGEQIAKPGTSEVRELFLSAIDANAQLLVLQGIPPSDSNIRQGDVLCPLNLVIHQKVEYACVLNQRSSNVQVIALDALPAIGFEGRTFDVAAARTRLNRYFEDHFGVSENADEQVYAIELLIAQPLAEHITSRQWHPNQSFESLGGGKVTMKMNCGINRELIGWILSHGNEIQVIAPDALRSIIIRQHADALALYNEPGKGLLQIAS